MNDLALPDPQTGLAQFEEIVEEVRRLHEKSRADATRTAYGRCWQRFERWAEAFRVPALPCSPETVSAFIGVLSLAKLSKSSAYQYLAAIRREHMDHGLDSPTAHPAIREIMKGYARDRRDDVAERVNPLLTEDIERIVSAMDPSHLRDVRDKALILVGFAFALRRSELARMQVHHMHVSSLGLDLHIPWSKADQEGVGQDRQIPNGSNVHLCPKTAWTAWLQRSGVSHGTAFRVVNRYGKIQGDGLSPQAIWRAVKDRAEAVGLGVDDTASFGAHSLRHGFATQATLNGVPRAQVMEDGGWRSSAVDRYIRAGQDRTHRAGGRLGL